MTMTPSPCPLCQTDGGSVLWRDALCRVVRADEPDYPGFLRVILNAHVREMTDLPVVEREALMRIVFACEAALREVLAPDKVNLASLGNVVPHLHWHVIPRFGDDPHFPNPVWGVRQRDSLRAVQPELDARLAAAINRLLARAREKG
jgi:diadenosine tetraphosphate (Ap4A) HIT family hydrolase